MAKRIEAPKVSDLDDVVLDQMALYSPNLLQSTAEARDMYETSPETSKDIIALCNLLGLASAVRLIPYEKATSEINEDYNRTTMQMDVLKDELQQQSGPNNVTDLSIVQAIHALDGAREEKTAEAFENKINEGTSLTEHYPDFLLCTHRLPESGYAPFMAEMFKDEPLDHPHSDVTHLVELGDELFGTLPETPDELLAHGATPETLVTDIETPAQKHHMLNERLELLDKIQKQLYEEMSYLETAKPILEDIERSTADTDVSKACYVAIKLCDNVEKLYGKAQSLTADIHQETKEELTKISAEDIAEESDLGNTQVEKIDRKENGNNGR